MSVHLVTDIVLAHHFISPPGWQSDEYSVSRRHHGFVLVLSGEADYRMSGADSFRVREGDMLYLPRTSSYITATVSDTAFVHLTVNFDLAGNDTLSSSPRLLHPAQPGRFSRVFSSLVRFWSQRHMGMEEMAFSCLYELMSLFLQADQSAPPSHRDRILPAMRYLEEHACEPCPVPLLASLCGISCNYLRRLFREVYRESPEECRTRIRITRACDLLLSTPQDISAVAEACGFPDPAYFSRIFRLQTGFSPTGYRKSR